MKSTISFAAVLLMLVICDQSLYSQEKGKDVLVYGGDYAYEPFEFINQEGKPDGFDIDLINAIAKEIGMTVVFDLGKWPEIKDKFENKNLVDVASMFDTPARRKKYLFAESHFVISHEIIVRKGEKKIDKLEDIKGMEVMLNASAVLQEILKDDTLGIKIIPVNTGLDALRRLSAGVHDVAILNQQQIHLLIDKYHLTNLTTAKPLIFPLDLCFVTTHRNAELIARISAGLESIKESGEYSSIYVKWFKADEEPGFFEKYGIYIVMIVLLIVTVGGAIIWSLLQVVEHRTKQVRKQMMKSRLTRELLQMKNSELVKKNRGLDYFVHRSSHDLIAPLKSISGLIHIAELEEKDQQQLTYFEMMKVSLRKLEDFIKRIQDYSYNSTRQIQKAPIILNQLIDEIINELRYLSNFDQIGFIKTFKPDAVLYSDAERIEIILKNLVINAIKYSKSDISDSFVEVELIEHDNAVTLSVKDNGIGVEQENLERIFEMFFRASERAEGSGLGLYIVKDTVIKLGGTIDIQSVEHEGTTFIISLPKGLPQ